MGILFLPLLVVVMYFLLIRPQQKRMKEHRAVLADLDVGDDIVTAGGIYGRVSELDGETLFIKVTDDVELKITKESVAGLVNYDPEADHDDDVDDEADVDDEEVDISDELVDDE